MIAHGDLVIVRSARLQIRKKTLADAPQDYRWRTDPDVARFDGARPLGQAYEDFLRTFETELLAADPTRQLYAVDTREGRHIGNVMYYNADTMAQSAEVGLSLGEPDVRGNGFGSEAMTAFTFYLWHAFPYSTLFLHTLEWNTRAQHAFARSGYSPAGSVTRAHDRYVRMEARREPWLREFDQGRLPRDQSPSLATPPPE